MTPSIGGAYIPVDPNALESGESNFARTDANAAASMTSGALRIGFFTARKTFTATKLRVCTSTTAAGATPTLVRFGLYTVASNGDITLAASTENDTALLASQSTQYEKALSASYGVSAGLRYGIGVLVVTGATAPTIAGLSVSTASAEAGASPKICAAVSGQTDLPASVAAGSVASSTIAVYGALIP